MLLAPIKVVFFILYINMFALSFITDDLIYKCFLYMWLLTHTSLTSSCVTIVTTFLSQPLHAGPTLLEQLHNVSLQRKVLLLKRRCYWHSERIFFCLWCCYCCCFFHWCFNFELLCFFVFLFVLWDCSFLAAICCVFSEGIISSGRCWHEAFWSWNEMLFWFELLQVVFCLHIQNPILGTWNPKIKKKMHVPGHVNIR